MNTTTTKQVISRKRARTLAQPSSVQVINCASAFPISSRKNSEQKRISTIPKPDPLQQPATNTQHKDIPHDHVSPSKILDWNVTVSEVRSLASTAFVGQQKRDFEAEAYMKLTGRKPRQQNVPMQIRRGIQRKAAQREAQQLQEARAAGIVLPTKSKKQTKQNRDNNFKKKQIDSTSRLHGPAPSIGFVKKGVYRVNRNTIASNSNSKNNDHDDRKRQKR